MRTLSDLEHNPASVAELRGVSVLIAAASATEEVVVHDGDRRADATMLFEHETIAMMRAGRAQEIANLLRQLSPKSVVVPIVKKAGSVWDETTVGRAATNDIVLADPTVSNVHAHFQEGTDGMCLSDLGSSNGTFLNRQPLQPHRRMPLRTGDCVRFGQAIFYFVPPETLQDLLR